MIDPDCVSPSEVMIKAAADSLTSARQASKADRILCPEIRGQIADSDRQQFESASVGSFDQYHNEAIYPADLFVSVSDGFDTVLRAARSEVSQKGL